MANTSRWSVQRLRPAFPVTMQLVGFASEIWGVETWRLIKRDRTRKVAYARFGIIWTLRQLGVTYWAIAHHLNFKEHTAVRYAFNKAERMREEDPDFRAATDALLAHAFNCRLAQIKEQSNRMVQEAA